MPKNFDRISQVNETIRLSLAKRIPHILGLDPSEIITITRVQTSRDLGHAKIFVTMFPDDKQKFLFERLIKRSKELRYELAQETSLFRVPDLSFQIDTTEKNAQHIEALLDSLNNAGS
ncbi:MAG: ribosome-binding factor A [Candidatus Kerfeldbacteria bacterium CG08_land_8_20_14_0_20_42_7]|uniref:Ribosome-binding factor A n=1 Tax=Candidatus Kerfeldbacteria bacterium CG08_land_8_20_14_0_20_42_7 TaxID=2014245 RepID=A0A2H0YV22_9BACT|nr:MAG: ribosome-binding factor A [Candidatus Kerfeldbacteria bacterium CG08_land_8_20_14_0_20_42_7]